MEVDGIVTEKANEDNRIVHKIVSICLVLKQVPKQYITLCTHADGSDFTEEINSKIKKKNFFFKWQNKTRSFRIQSHPFTPLEDFPSPPWLKPSVLERMKRGDFVDI
jgi:hypothetical protein